MQNLGSLPGYQYSLAYAINDAGQVVGTYTTSVCECGFSYDLSSHSFTTISVPSALSTTAFGINNDGRVVGSDLVPDVGIEGFLKTGNHFMPVEGPFFGAYGINNAGQIVGVHFGASDFGFVDIGGHLSGIRVPDAQSTEAYGINNADQIVGTYQSSGTSNGFVDTKGSFSTIDVPGASDTIASGINDAGQISGSYIDATGVHGFVYSVSTRAFTKINVGPQPPDTVVWGINNAGDTVGYVPATPEPASLVLFGSGVAAIVWRKRTGRRPMG